MQTLGELLKELRGKRSLREIADLTNLSHTYISDIEKGYRRGTKKAIHPSPETLKRLSEAYNYPYEKLMTVAGYIDTKDFNEAIEQNTISLTEEEVKVVKEIMKHPVAFENLKANPEKNVKQMIQSWSKVKEMLKEIDEDDSDYLE